MSLKAQLEKARANWKKGKETSPDFGSPVPDGTYVGKLVKVELNESQSSGRLQAHFQAVISTGEYKGESINWYSGLKTDQNMMYFQRDIVRLGHDAPEDINDVEDILKEISKEKPSIRFKVVTDGEYTNVRLLKRLDTAEAPEEEETEEPEEPEAEEEEPETKKKEEIEEEEVIEEEEESDDDPEIDVAVGLRVLISVSGKDQAGTITEINEREEKVVVKTDAGKKFRVGIDKLKPAPKTKVSKKK